jgi:hypothetical protein
MHVTVNHPYRAHVTQQCLCRLLVHVPTGDGHVMEGRGSVKLSRRRRAHRELHGARDGGIHRACSHAAARAAELPRQSCEAVAAGIASIHHGDRATKRRPCSAH